MTFGSLLRHLRYKQGFGIKKLARDLDIDYTYLSKLENDKATPSERVINKVSKYFNYNTDQLMLSADKIPEDIRQILRGNPEEALTYLRGRFSGHGREREGELDSRNRGSTED